MPSVDVDLDRVEAACRAIAAPHNVTVQLRAKNRAIACWFEIGGRELRAWELRAGADARELDELWRRCGYDGVQRIAIEIAIATPPDGEPAMLTFDARRGTNLLARRAGDELARALAAELGAVG
jgi:hypothetical protein